MSAFGGKAGHGVDLSRCPLLTQSGHGVCVQEPRITGLFV